MSDEKDKIKITIPEYSGEEFAPDAAPSNEPAAPVEEIKKAEKILTDNDEIAAFNKEVLGELEPPLVVHKKSDTSYDNNNNSVLENCVNILVSSFSYRNCFRICKYIIYRVNSYKILRKSQFLSNICF